MPRSTKNRRVPFEKKGGGHHPPPFLFLKKSKRPCARALLKDVRKLLKKTALTPVAPMNLSDTEASCSKQTIPLFPARQPALIVARQAFSGSTMITLFHSPMNWPKAYTAPSTTSLDILKRGLRADRKVGVEKYPEKGLQMVASVAEFRVLWRPNFQAHSGVSG